MDPNNGTNTDGQSQVPDPNGGQSEADDSATNSQQPDAGEGGKGAVDDASGGNNGKPGDETNPDDGKGKDPDPKEGEGEQGGAPESYEAFTLPEGWALEGERLESFVALAKRANLTQAEAQAEIDRYTADAGAALGAQASKQISAWGEQLKADPEFGGAGFEANLAAAGKAVAEFGGEQLANDLDTYGLGNLPSLNKAFLAAHQTIEALRKENTELKAEGSMPGLGSRSSGAPKSIADRMYPNANK